MHVEYTYIHTHRQHTLHTPQRASAHTLHTHTHSYIHTYIYAHRQHTLPTPLNVPVRILLPRELLRTATEQRNSSRKGTATEHRNNTINGTATEHGAGTVDVVFILDACAWFGAWQQVCMYVCICICVFICIYMHIDCTCVCVCL